MLIVFLFYSQAHIHTSTCVMSCLSWVCDTFEFIYIHTYICEYTSENEKVLQNHYLQLLLQALSSSSSVVVIKLLIYRSLKIVEFVSWRRFKTLCNKLSFKKLILKTSKDILSPGLRIHKYRCTMNAILELLGIK